ncbi:MAG TPA: hypothetical protein VMR25_15150 [Planctomycetaceae bacterium]|jgi:hypothetical protein|nr:hypothetical protein [Planctomycetaceae bacterium]
MHDVPSEPHIDLEARSRDEQDKRLVAGSDTVNVDELADTVRIQRTPRVQAPQREMDRQPWLLD